MKIGEGGLPYWGMKNKQKVIFTFSLIVLAGVVSIFTMPRQADPNLRILQGIIVAQCPGLDEVAVEKEVTEVIEDYLFQSKQINRSKTTSLSIQGVSIVKVELTPDVADPTVVWSKIQHGLNALPIPKAVVQTEWADITQVIITVSSNVRSFKELKLYADTIQEVLQHESEVSGIQQIGKQQEVIDVLLDKNKMIYYGVDLETVLQAITLHHQAQPVSVSKHAGTRIPIGIDGQLHSAQEIKEIPIVLSQGKSTLIKDIGIVKNEYQEPTTLIGTTGKAIMLAINLRTNINEVAFGEKLNLVLNSLSQRLPPDLTFKTIVSEPEFVRGTINQFAFEFFFVIAMVVVALLIMSPLRTALVSALAAPISILMTIAFLRLFKLPLHQVTLAGLVLSLGMVVDDAIVVSDNFRELTKQGMSISKASWLAAQQLMRPLLVRTVCIMATFFPLAIFTVGLSKEFMLTLPITVALALGSSLLVALFITPAMCEFLAKWKTDKKHVKSSSGIKGGGVKRKHCFIPV